MARSGTHQGQAASVLDQILPAVVSGRLIVWTEATPTSTARLLQLRPTLRSLFEAVRLEPQDPATHLLGDEQVNKVTPYETSASCYQYMFPFYRSIG